MIFLVEKVGFDRFKSGNLQLHCQQTSSRVYRIYKDADLGLGLEPISQTRDGLLHCHAGL